MYESTRNERIMNWSKQKWSGKKKELRTITVWPQQQRCSINSSKHFNMDDYIISQSTDIIVSRICRWWLYMNPSVAYIFRLFVIHFQRRPISRSQYDRIRICGKCSLPLIDRAFREYCCRLYLHVCVHACVRVYVLALVIVPGLCKLKSPF